MSTRVPRAPAHSTGEHRCVVFYDCDAVSEEHVTAALELCGPAQAAVEHVKQAGSEWRAQPSVRPTELPSLRSPAFRSYLTNTLNELFAYVRAMPAGRQLRYRGLDLLDVARSECFTAVGGVLYPLWVLEQLLQRHPHQLVWVSEVANHGLFGPMGRLLAGRSIALHHVVVGGSLPSPPKNDPSRSLQRAARWLRRFMAEIALPRATGGAPPPGATRILFVEAFANHVGAAAELATHISSRTNAQAFFVVSRPAVAEAARIRGVADAQPLVHVATRRARFEARLRRLATRRLGSAVAEAVGRDTKSPLGPLSALAEPGLRDALGPAWQTAAYVSPLCCDVVDRYRPQAVVSTTNVPSIVRAMTRHARAAGVPAVYLQHGALIRETELSSNSRGPAPQQDEHDPPLHDEYLVWGERDKRRLQAEGVPGDQIAVTGSLKFEKLARMADSGADQSGREFRVLYLPSRSGGRFVSVGNSTLMLDLVQTAVSRMAGATLTVKPHPADTSAVFEQVDVIRGGDAIQAIASADAVMVATSTAGLEACALGRPVVVLSLPGVQLPAEYVDYGAALLVSNVEELVSALQSIRDGGEVAHRLKAGRRKLIDDMFAGLEPGAVRRSADRVLTVAGAFS